MTEAANQILGIVPQSYFDLIGRVVPGVALIGATILVFPELHPSVLELADHCESSALAASACGVFGLSVSYLVGTLLGAIGYLLFDQGWQKWNLAALRAELEADLGGYRGGIPFRYDVLQRFDVVSAARLGKLSAEIHMCRVVMFGAGGLWVANLALRIDVGDMRFQLSFWGLAAAALFALLFMLHLSARRLICMLVNIRVLLHLGQLPAETAAMLQPRQIESSTSRGSPGGTPDSPAPGIADRPPRQRPE